MLLLALLLAAPATPFERDDAPHLALVIGAGRAYGYMGAHLEVRWRTVALFVGSTPLPGLASQHFLSENNSVVAGGIRFISNGGSGVLVSLQAAAARYDHHLEPGNDRSPVHAAGHDTYTATVGWRARAGPAIFDVGLGGGVAHDFDRQDSFPRRLSRSTYPIPDFALGLGFEL